MSLVAEDNVVNTKACRQTLGKVGVYRRTGKYGREVLLAWSGEPFDLVLMDVQMPIWTACKQPLPFVRRSAWPNARANYRPDRLCHAR